jgi:hypothetical protein
MEEDVASNQRFGVYNDAVDAMRKREYPMLEGKCYLDHAGTTVRLLNIS